MKCYLRDKFKLLNRDTETACTLQNTAVNLETTFSSPEALRIDFSA